MEPARTFFWNVGHVRILIYILAIIPVVFIVYGLYKRYLLWKQGVPENRTQNLSDRISSLIQNGLFQKRLFKEGYPGLMHGLMFFGFAILFIGTVLIALQEDVTFPLFHWEYLKGNFYLLYSLVLDIFGILAIIGVLMALYRRLILKPDRLDQRKDDNPILYLFLFILVTGFLVEGFRILANELPAHPAWSKWSPIGLATALMFKDLGVGIQGGLTLHRIFWWLHLAAAFTFLSLIPYTKLIHIFTGSADTFLRPDPPKGRLIPLDIENSETFGVEKYHEFSWKQLFDLDACIRCGRCQDVCPAYMSGKPLSPKAFIQDLRAGLEQGLQGEDAPGILESFIKEETIWSCTTCRACEEACPLFIEHVPKHMEIRRHQTLVKTKFPSELRTTFRGIERQGNPWGVPKAQRDEWTGNLKDMEVPAFTEDIAESGYLLWVGCACSVDENNMKTAMAMVRLLTAAGIPFGILGRQELCCGDPARRLGNEYLFQMEAEENIALFNELGVKRIITLCPHGYHTFKNEYPDFGGNYEVYHYTEILHQILGKLRIKKTEGTVTYHDPCYLGRYNDIYDIPREIIAQAGSQLKEMDHHHDRSLCCGGGGGRIFMEEEKDQRVSHLRIDEAVRTHTSVVLTACPHCLTMLTDGAKEKEVSDQIEAMDIARWLESHLEESSQSS